MKIGIVGCAGRMGRMLMSSTLETTGVQLVAGIEHPNSAAVGQDLGTLAGKEPIGLIAGNDPSVLFRAADAVIDFTVPKATQSHALLAREYGTILVVGTTGLQDDHIAALTDAGKSVAVVHSGNMSLGVNLLVGLVEQVAHSLGNDYDIEIIEMHHKHKIDAPSGTALMLGEAAARGRQIDMETNSIKSRVGETGPRPTGSIGYATLRGGDVIGEHSTIFVGQGERIELSHRATDRALFAKGAIHAAVWAKNQTPGLYSMQNVLGLK